MKKMMSEYIRTVLEIDDTELIDEFINGYFALFDETLPSMKTALEGRDFHELRTLAHMIKGSSANIGAEPARALSLELQDAADAGNETDCGTLIDKLKTLREENPD